MGDMNAPLRVRIRDGCRGGREQFKWNQITEQDFKDREQYLGQSTKVGMMGKFGRYYQHDWYQRKRDKPEDLADEMATVRAYEEELMQEALGKKPKKLMLSKKQLTEEEIQEHLKRDEDKSVDKKGMVPMGPQKKIVTNEYGEQVATSNEDFVAVAAREAPVKGLGFAMHRTSKLEEIKAQTFGTTSQLSGSALGGSSSSVKGEVKYEKAELKDEVKREEDMASVVDGVVDVRARASSELKDEMSEVERHAKKHSRDRNRADEPLRSKSEQKKEKRRRKDEKKIKKLEKKMKKAAKKEKKAAKKAKKARGAAADSSSSSSSSS